MMTYLNDDIKGIRNKIRLGNNTRQGSPRNHVYKVNIYGFEYWKFQIHRKNKHKTKYFKTRKDAVSFVKKLNKVKNYKKVSDMFS